VNVWQRLTTFLGEVRTEMRKTTWPSRREVQGTTLVVIVTSFVFAVFLWLVDLVLQQVVTRFAGLPRA